MHVCKWLYCDFVVWSENDGFIVERIHADEAFFQSIVDAQYFFTYGILPEIVGKWYTQVRVADSTGIVPIPTNDNEGIDPDEEDYKKLWYYCNQPSHGLMIVWEQ